MLQKITNEEKLDLIQNEIYTIDNIHSIFEDVMAYGYAGLTIHDKLITLLELEKEHIKKIINLF